MSPGGVGVGLVRRSLHTLPGRTELRGKEADIGRAGRAAVAGIKAAGLNLLSSRHGGGH